MWALVTKTEPRSLYRTVLPPCGGPIWGLCGLIGQFLEEFFSETQLTLPAKRRSFGSCQCPPRVGKHYQNYDEDSHYHRYCDNSFQCSPWRKDYPRRSQKEVERTNNDGGPVAPWFEHP